MARAVRVGRARRPRVAPARAPQLAAAAAPWYALGVVVGEVVYATISAPLGLGLEACLLLAIVVHYGTLRAPRGGPRAVLGPDAALPALATIPLLRLLGFAALVPGTTRLASYALGTALVALVLVLAAATAAFRPVWTPRRDASSRLEWLVLGTAIPIGLLAWLIERPRPLAHGIAGAAGAVVVLLAAAAVEELLLRGLLLDALVAALGRIGPAYAALVGAAVYAGSGSPYVAVLLGGFGAWLVLARARGAGLRACVGAHALLAVLAFAVLPALA
jgi:hypothetical protein